MHLVAQEHRTRSDNDLAAMVEALAEQSMYDAMLHMHETVQVTINIDEIIDEKGVPVPPANMTELEKRKYKADWEAAWQGIMEREILTRPEEAGRGRQVLRGAANVPQRLTSHGVTRPRRGRAMSTAGGGWLAARSRQGRHGRTAC